MNHSGLRKVQLYFLLIMSMMLITFFVAGCRSKTYPISTYVDKTYKPYEALFIVQPAPDPDQPLDPRSIKGKSVSLIASADSEHLDYSIASYATRIDFGEYGLSMTLEKQIDGEWRVIPKQGGTYNTLGYSANIGSYFINSIFWSSYYDTNPGKGKYRLIFTFRAGVSDYNEVSEFIID